MSNPSTGKPGQTDTTRGQPPPKNDPGSKPGSGQPNTPKPTPKPAPGQGDDD